MGQKVDSGINIFFSLGIKVNRKPFENRTYKDIASEKLSPHWQMQVNHEQQQDRRE